MAGHSGRGAVVGMLVMIAGAGTRAAPTTFVSRDGEIVEAECEFLMVGGDPNGDPPDSPAKRIDPNTPDPISDLFSPFAGVGSLEILIPGRTSSICTATPITPRHVITAAHCVVNVPLCGLSFTLNYGSNRSHVFRISATNVHPDVDRRRLSVHDDLAVVTLAEPLPLDIPIYEIDDEPLAPGDVVTMVGYGWTGDGVDGFSFPAPIRSPVKRMASNAADMMVPDDEGRGFDEVFIADFDAPDGSDGRLGGPTLGNQVEGTPGFGDSGGPCFVFRDGRWKIAGIISIAMRFTNPIGPRFPLFGSGMGGALVAPSAAWIRSFDPATAGSDGPRLSPMVNLEFRDVRTGEPAFDLVTGDPIELGLFAVTTGTRVQEFTAVEVILGWDADALELGGTIRPDPNPWIISGFIARDSSGINEQVPPKDGDGYWIAFAPDARPVRATKRGTLLQTFRFRSRAESRRSVIEVRASGGSPPIPTVVPDPFFPRQELTGCLGLAIVRVGAFEQPEMPPIILDADPPEGWIDPRAPTDASGPAGIREIAITFDQIIFDANGTPPSAATFRVETTNVNPDLHVPGTSAPVVEAVDTSENPLIRVRLSEPIPVGEWTTLLARVENGAGNEIDVRVRVAHLPLDLDQDGVVNLHDVAAFTAEWDADEPRLTILDLNHDAQINAQDVSTFADLGRGTDELSAFAGRSLPPRD